jgi:hypothetical protein
MDTARHENRLSNKIIPQGTDTGGRGAPSDPGEFGVAWCCNGGLTAIIRTVWCGADAFGIIWPR